MTNKATTPPLTGAELDLDKLEALARAATPQNLDSAEDATRPTGCVECPECGGEGTVELTADYCNYDGKAMGVQFYGVGPEHLAAEAFFRAANPATILRLIAQARAQQAGAAPAEPFGQFHTRRFPDGSTFTFQTRDDDPDSFPLYAAAVAPSDAKGKADDLTGRIVSVDVSTCDDDHANRIFAELTGETGSDGTTLLAIETERNFDATGKADATNAGGFDDLLTYPSPYGTLIRLADAKCRMAELERNLAGALRALGAENGATFMGEPAIPARAALDIDAMVNRFLAWPLPKDFSPDCGISFDGRKDDEWNKNKTWPTGTNLLAATQAKAMFEYCIARQSPATSAADAKDAEQMPAAIRLLREARATLEMWKDVAPAVSLCADIDSALARTAKIHGADTEARDAARWRAFLGSSRIRPLGSAGLGEPMPGNYAHIGLEMWTAGAWGDPSSKLGERLAAQTKLGAEWLIKYADVAIAAQQAQSSAKGGDAVGGA